MTLAEISLEMMIPTHEIMDFVTTEGITLDQFYRNCFVHENGVIMYKDGCSRFTD